MANAIERETTTLQLKERKLVTEIKRTAKTGNEQMSPAKQTEEETEELTNQVLDEIRVDVASLRKRKTFKAPCIIDEALRKRASPSLPHSIDGPSFSSVSRMKRKRKTFKAPCTIDEALRVRASPSLPRTMDGPSSSSVSSPHTISTTLTRRGRGFTRGIKEWGIGTKIQVQNPRANLRRKRQRKRENLEDGPNISWTEQYWNIKEVKKQASATLVESLPCNGPDTWLEIICTFVFFFASIWIAFDDRQAKALGRVVFSIVGSVISLLVFISTMVTTKKGYAGAEMNPARCFEPVMVRGGHLWNGHWVF
ncbi:hypothetical protein LOK49_LG14G01051 [Camellia lanceoleosa]|uniref:Uncharacterized protein n=1 Tax=Camellia lanceoleosa TaxID=1840588 RepID=A0ACC0F7V5_9ERIC|nr:hypothetical protein LOK49_LG14G01051 [Camellia lanceoleosa]